MLTTFHEYIDKIYQFVADAAVEDHLWSSVFKPLELLKKNAEVDVESHRASPEEDFRSNAGKSSRSDREALKLFATPPCTTSFRFTGFSFSPHVQHLPSDFHSLHLDHPEIGRKVFNCTPSSLLHDGTENFSSIQNFASIGTPFCYALRPKCLERTFPCHEPPTNGSSSSETDLYSSVVKDKNIAMVVVNISCAEAILRGSDVYAPGIITVSRPIHVGDKVLLVAQVKREEVVSSSLADTVSNESSKSLATGTSSSAEEAHILGKNDATQRPNEALTERKTFQWKTSLIQGEKLVLPPSLSHFSKKINEKRDTDFSDRAALNYPFAEEGNGEARHGGHCHLSPKESSENTFFVILGGGTAMIASKGIIANFGKQKSIAVAVTWNVWCQPSRSQLKTILLSNRLQARDEKTRVNTEKVANTIRDSKVPLFFLQNFSSMLPPQLLVQHLPSSCWQIKKGHENRNLNRTDVDSVEGDQNGVNSQSSSFHSSCIFSRFPCVLDACAAPGGKSSLLVSLLYTRAIKERSKKCFSCGTLDHTVNEGMKSLEPRSPLSTAFRLVCCERSSTKYTQMKKLLQEHFASENKTKSSELFSKVCVCICKDLNHLVKEHLESQTSSWLKYFKENEGCPASHMEERSGDQLDAVLFDPPCSGFGLRPKLLPHLHSLKSIRGFADCQRKLFDSAIRLLSRNFSSNAFTSPSTSFCPSPKIIVYSTSTITLEENEENILYFLQAYPELRLARAKGREEQSLCTKFGIAPSCNSSEHSSEKQATPFSSSQKRSCNVLLADKILALQEEKESKCRFSSFSSSPSEPPPVLLLRIMPKLWRSTVNSSIQGAQEPELSSSYIPPLEDGVGFFVAVFELWCS